MANRLLITADGGGSNGSRVKLWKLKLQELADETGFTVTVCHYPPGTSKWNKACPRESGDRASPLQCNKSELARETVVKPHGHR